MVSTVKTVKLDKDNNIIPIKLYHKRYTITVTSTLEATYDSTMNLFRYNATSKWKKSHFDGYRRKAVADRIHQFHGVFWLANHDTSEEYMVKILTGQVLAYNIVVRVEKYGIGIAELSVSEMRHNPDHLDVEYLNYMYEGAPKTEIKNYVNTAIRNALLYAKHAESIYFRPVSMVNGSDDSPF